jgi:hypothetical protein
LRIGQNLCAENNEREEVVESGIERRPRNEKSDRKKSKLEILTTTRPGSIKTLS